MRRRRAWKVGWGARRRKSSQLIWRVPKTQKQGGKLFVGPLLKDTKRPVTYGDEPEENTEAGSRPKAKIQAGSVSCALWENEIGVDGRKTVVLKATIERRYRDAAGTWQSSNSFGRNEISLAIYSLQKAFERMLETKAGDDKTAKCLADLQRRQPEHGSVCCLGERPSDSKNRQGSDTEEELYSQLRPYPVGHFSAEGAQYCAAQETKHVGRDVGALSACTKVTEQENTSDQRHPPFHSRGQASLSSPGMPRNQAHRCEDGGGSADGRVVRRADPGIEKIACGATDKYAAPRTTRTKQSAGEQSHETADDDVSKQVLKVVVQGQGGYRPPPLALSDQACVRLAGFKPIQAKGMLLLPNSHDR